MANRTLSLSDALHAYLVEHSVREPDILRRLRAETAQDSMSMMQISPEQGQFMQLLVKLMGARQCLEIGVFTGYSSLSIALALPMDGHIVACDVSEKWTAIARKYWKEAGVARKIKLHIAPALETLDNLIAGGQGGVFDFVFIDADKINYLNYYERALVLARTGGLIAVDNTLWGGQVVDTSSQSEDTRAIRSLNEKLRSDPRVQISLLPIGDGLTLALKL
ncbi:MAG TPA: class I SAM-dependent methyltransferase [Burkholderiales bacterium]|jgi:predicted O-methyltransferase YrrM|nr:class I SAM-dependent methyltransferase [Burkholderiales bacterium]